MSERIGVCSGCGARFKIPESFQGSSAPCKKCDGVIKIGPATATATAPAAVAPPAAKPAPSRPAAAPGAAAPAGRPSAKPAPAKASSAAERAGGGSRRAGRDAGRDGDGRRGGRGGDGAKAGNPMLLVGGIAGVLVIGGVVGFMMMGDDDQPTAGGNTASANTAASPAGGTAPTGTGGPSAAPEPTQPPTPVASTAGSSTAGDAAATPSTSPAPADPTPAPDAASSDPEPAAKTPDSPNPDGEIGGEVMSKFEFTALEKAPGTTEEEWTAIKELAVKLEDSGKPRKRAMEKLIPYGMKAVPACINFLNGLDLTDGNQWVTGFEIATFIQDKLTSGTILIPYHGDFSSDPKEINRNHKVLTSIVSYWNSQTSSDVRWKALMEKYEEKKSGSGRAVEEGGGE